MKKIPTLFKRRFEGHKIVEVLPIITPGCEEAFAHGLATIKYDGSACAIIGGQLYKRFDAKPGKVIPKGAIKCQDSPDPVTGHFPHWLKCDRENPEDRWFINARDNFAKANGWTNLIPDGTYEAVGLHFRGNPYGLESDTLLKHGLQCIDVARTFEGVKEWLEENDEEGLVFWLNGEPMCKIKRTDFGLKWGR